MHFTLSTAIEVYIGLFTMGTIAIGIPVLWTAIYGDTTQVSWRAMKTISACLAGVSLLIFVMSIEGAVKRLFSADADRLITQNYIDLRQFIMSNKIEVCGANKPENVDPNSCYDLKSIEYSVETAMRDKKVIALPPNWAKNPYIDALQKQLEIRAEQINLFIRPRSEEHEVITRDTYIKLLIFAPIPLGLSLLLSIGESVYQWRRAIEDQNNSPTKKRLERKLSSVIRRLRLRQIGKSKT